MHKGLGHDKLPAMVSSCPMTSLQGSGFDPQAACLQSLLQRVNLLEAALAQTHPFQSLAPPADTGCHAIAAQQSLMQSMCGGSSGLPIPALLSAGHMVPAHEQAATLQSPLASAYLLALAQSVSAAATQESAGQCARAGHPVHSSNVWGHCAAWTTVAKETPSVKKPPADAEEECTSDASSDTVKNSVPRPAARVAPVRKQTGHRSQWSPEEHQRFLTGLARFGRKDRDPASAKAGARVSVGLGPGVAEVIAVVVGTRTVSQVRSHAQKYFLRQTRTTSNGMAQA